ncbi:hypothetical protein F2Q69_00010997 [Brassica cretica]|uniref:Uncharacterized protein n=1 Tax=Brassica cretica TaxID=69181 RepID=A0A8S9R8V8_BRACR|nr:hypothetical protein F2Q69_00010997 [Brassica cretica]
MRCFSTAEVRLRPGMSSDIRSFVKKIAGSPEQLSVAAFAVLVSLLPPPSSLVSSFGCYGKNFPHLFQVEKTILRHIVKDFFSVMVSRQPPWCKIGSRSVGVSGWII